jgi:hypothetical protein
VSTIPLRYFPKTYNKRLLIWGATACIGCYLSVAHDKSFVHAMNAATLVATVQTILDDDRDRGNDEKGDRS